ncbi:MAG: acetyltransferase [Clostridia bacterium BRH_c25]|nr:MAG: acetyltransferase [Clostridia bacterium BRH_c25]
MSIYIETERLILRQFTIEDAEELSSICNQEYILKWMPDWEGTVEGRRSWLIWIQDQYEKANKDTARIMLAVTLKGNESLIGMVGIGNKEEVDNEIEIAYFISEDYCNKGFMSEAAKTMSQWALNTLGIEYLIAIVEIDNYPSQKIVEKCGFTKVGTRMILNSGEAEEKPFYYYRLYSG